MPYLTFEKIFSSRSLMLHYLKQKGTAPFFPIHFQDVDNYSRLYSELRSRNYPRAGLVDILYRQNRDMGASEKTFQNINALKDENSVVVLGGQQAGLFTGPIFTIYKALSVLQISEKLGEQLGVNLLPVFWIASDDHDLEEINHIQLPDASGFPVKVELPGSKNEVRLPIGQITVSTAIEQLISQIEKMLPSSEYAKSWLEMARESYAPGVPLAQAFGRLLHKLIPNSGLILVDPHDSQFKQLAVSLFLREIEENSPVTRLVLRQSELLEKAGFVPRLQLKENYLNLFYHSPGRNTLILDGDKILCKQSNEQFTLNQLVQILKQHPERFSPNAAFRPLMQDYIFPTLAMVLGGSEIEYFGQLGLAYQEFEIPMPVPVPRVSVTVLDPKSVRILKKFDMKPEDIIQNSVSLTKEIIRREIPDTLFETFHHAKQQVQAATEGLRASLKKFDQDLDKAAGVAGNKILAQFDFLEKKLLQAAKRKDEILRHRLTALQNLLLPNEKLQERVFNVAYFWSRYGSELFPKIYDDVDVFRPVHYIIDATC